MFRQAGARTEGAMVVSHTQMACAWESVASLQTMTAQIAAIYEHVADTHAEALHEGADPHACAMPSSAEAWLRAMPLTPQVSNLDIARSYVRWHDTLCAPGATTTCCRQVLVLDGVFAPGACVSVADAIKHVEAVATGSRNGRDVPPGNNVQLESPFCECDSAEDIARLLGTPGANVLQYVTKEEPAFEAWRRLAAHRVFAAPTSLLMRNGRCASAIVLVVHLDDRYTVCGTTVHIAVTDADAPTIAKPVDAAVFVFDAPVAPVRIKQWIAPLQSHTGYEEAVTAIRNIDNAWRLAVVYAASRSSMEPLLRELFVEPSSTRVAGVLHRVLSTGLKACSGRESRQLGSYVSQYNRVVGQKSAPCTDASPKRKRRAKGTGGRPSFTVERYMRILDESMRSTRAVGGETDRAALVVPFVEELRMRHELHYFEHCLPLIECTVTWARDAALAAAVPSRGYAASSSNAKLDANTSL